MEDLFGEPVKQKVKYYVLRDRITGRYVGNYSKRFRICPLRNDIKMAKKYTSFKKAEMAIESKKEYHFLEVVEVEE